MFPETDSSQTIVDTLLDAADAAGVSVHTSEGVTAVDTDGDHFHVETDAGNSYTAASVLIATGGTRMAAGRGSLHAWATSCDRRHRPSSRSRSRTHASRGCSASR